MHHFLIVCLILLSVFKLSAQRTTGIEYGITIITHGFIPSGGSHKAGDWSFKMGNTIVDKYGGIVHFYDATTGLFKKSYDNGAGETVLIFDWAEESNFDGLGFSEAAGDALFAALMRSGFPLNNLHFIGHSRGAVVNTECVLRLLNIGIPVDHVTNLDAHDWGAVKIGTDFDNHPELDKIEFPGTAIFKNYPGVISWEKVRFSDSYYQTNGEVSNIAEPCGTCFLSTLLGRGVEGTKNFWWNEYTISGKTIDMCHTNIHECAYLETILNPSVNKDGHYFSRLAGKNGREKTGKYPITKSFNFLERGFNNRIKGIYNGDFERGGAASSNHLPGWGARFGGSLTGSYKYVTGNNYVILRKNQHIRHNFFYIPKEAKRIKFKYDNNVKSISTLKVVINKFGSIPYNVFQKKLDTLTNGFIEGSFDVGNFSGSVVTMEFTIEGGSTAEVEIDDVEFGKASPGNTALLLFDLSGSMNENGAGASISKLEQAKNASKKTLNGLKNSNSGVKDEVGVLGFSGDCRADPTTQVSDFQTDLAAVEKSIDGMTASGGTPLAEAIEAAQCRLANHLDKNGQDKGKLIILSDGQATCGKIRPEGTYNSGQLGQQVITVKAGKCSSPATNIRYYTIGFNIAPGSPAERDLQYLSDISGGKYLNAQSQVELENAFRKFNRVYTPKFAPSSPDLPATSLAKFDEGVGQVNDESFANALQVFEDFAKLHNNDAHGAYNLAMMQEANELYRKSINNYQKYLRLLPNASDKVFVESQIAFLEDAFRQFLLFQKEVVKSDLQFLKIHFDKIQSGESVATAEEFKGFLKEKSAYYKKLPDLTGKEDLPFKRKCQEIVYGLESCAKTIKRSPQTWDRDSNATLSILDTNLQQLLEIL